jgi:hypothetical protein
MLNSCNHENSTNSNPLDFHSIVYTENPFEWYGEAHNEILEALVDTIDVNLYYSTTWPINSLVDTVRSFAESYMINEMGFSPDTLITTEADKWTNMLGNTEIMIDTLNAYLNRSQYTAIDKQYMTCVIDLVEEINDSPNLFDYSVFSSKVDSLETVILSQNWAVDDKLALMAISLLKHTAYYHCVSYPIISNEHRYKDNMILATKAQKVATISTDFIVGTGYFIGVTLATGGVGAGAAACTSCGVGAACSGFVDMVGGWFDWWD